MHIFFLWKFLEDEPIIDLKIDETIITVGYQQSHRASINKTVNAKNHVEWLGKNPLCILELHLVLTRKPRVCIIACPYMALTYPHIVMHALSCGTHSCFTIGHSATETIFLGLWNSESVRDAWIPLWPLLALSLNGPAADRQKRTMDLVRFRTEFLKRKEKRRKIG
jgi:hypothetical protein